METAGVIMILVAWAFVILVASFIRDNGNNMPMAGIALASFLVIMLGIIFVTVGSEQENVGFPAHEGMLEENSVYKVVGTHEVENNYYVVLQQPNGKPRLYQLKEKLPVVENHKYYKAVNRNGVLALEPLP